MGRKIKKASYCTFRSFLFGINKIITFLFALFCVVSGQVRKTTVSIKGKVLNSVDSSFIKNIKVVLNFDSMMDYGCIDSSMIPLDSAYSDENGDFEIILPAHKGKIFRLNDIDGSANGSFDRSIVMLSKTVKSDTIYNLYMTPSNVNINHSGKPNPLNSIIKTFQHKNIIITVADQQVGNIISTNIVDSKGRIVDTPEILSKNTIKWNTENTALGVYFITIITYKRKLITKIWVK